MDKPGGKGEEMKKTVHSYELPGYKTRPWNHLALSLPFRAYTPFFILFIDLVYLSDLVTDLLSGAEEGERHHVDVMARIGLNDLLTRPFLTKERYRMLMVEWFQSCSISIFRYILDRYICTQTRPALLVIKPPRLSISLILPTQITFIQWMHLNNNYDFSVTS